MHNDRNFHQDKTQQVRQTSFTCLAHVPSKVKDMALRIAEKVVTITDKLEIPYVFKGSFKKANRSRIFYSFTGIGRLKSIENYPKSWRNF